MTASGAEAMRGLRHAAPHVGEGLAAAVPSPLSQCCNAHCPRVAACPPTPLNSCLQPCRLRRAAVWCAASPHLCAFLRWPREGRCSRPPTLNGCFKQVGFRVPYPYIAWALPLPCMQGMSSSGTNRLLLPVAWLLDMLLPTLPVVRPARNELFPTIQQVGGEVRYLVSSAACAGKVWL